RNRARFLSVMRRPTAAKSESDCRPGYGSLRRCHRNARIFLGQVIRYLEGINLMGVVTKLTKISMAQTHNQRSRRLFLLLTLTAMIWTAALQVQAVSAQRLPDFVRMPSGHSDLTGETQQDPSMKAFVAN